MLRARRSLLQFKVVLALFFLPGPFPPPLYPLHIPVTLWTESHQIAFRSASSVSKPGNQQYDIQTSVLRLGHAALILRSVSENPSCLDQFPKYVLNKLERDLLFSLLSSNAAP